MLALFSVLPLHDDTDRDYIPSGAPAKTQPRIESVDILRGLACLFVVVYHLFALQPPPSAQEPPVAALLRSVFGFGIFGVPLFLCLSGFCLFWPVLRNSPLAEVRVDYRRFIGRRAWRILPPYYIALLAFILYELRFPEAVTGEYLGGAKSLLLHGLMLQNFSPNAVGAINEVFWSLALEWQMYLAFPLFLWLIRRGGTKGGLPLLVGVSLVVAVAWRVLALHYVGHADDWRQETVWYRSPFDFFWYFALGMAAATASLLGRVSVRAWMTGVGIAAFLPAIYLELHPGVLSPANFFWGLGFAGLLVGTRFVHLRRWDSSVWAVFTWPGHALARLGVCSYSVYLVHLPLLHWIASAFSPQCALLLSLPLVFLLGWLFYLTCERPFLIKRRVH